MQRNVAGQIWVVFAFNRTNNQPVTGDAANITGNLRLDGGAANAIDDVNPTELEDGFYFFNITQAESNADHLLIAPESITADVQVVGVPGAVWTRPPNFPALGIEAGGAISSLNGHTAQTGDSFARIGANGAGLTAVQLAAAGVDAIWDELTAGHVTVGSFGVAVTDILADTNELQVDDVPGLIAALNNLAIADVQTALTNQGYTAARAPNLDNLDATISSRQATLDAAARNAIADHVIRRTWANAEASADGDAVSFRSLMGAVAKLVNRVRVNGTTLEVYRDDDATILGSQTLTTNAAADPITEADTV